MNYISINYILRYGFYITIKKTLFKCRCSWRTSLPFLLQNEAFSAQKFYESKEGVAKNVIHVYLPGCALKNLKISKPYSPLEYRAPFNAINTSVPITIFKYNEEYGKSSKQSYYNS